MAKWQDLEIGKAIDFNPSEKLQQGFVAKKIPMDRLVAFQRKINGFEFSPYKAGPKFKNGDTLVAKITPCLENGKTALVDILDEGEVAFGSSEFIVLRQNEYSLSSFIYYLAQSPAFRKKAIGCMEGTSGRKRVNEGALKLQVLPIPGKTMQKMIASVLSCLDDKIELNQKISKNLELMAQTVYNYWFVQFDFPDSNGKPYKSSGGKMIYNEKLKRAIPFDWEVRSLLDIATFTNGIACQKFRPKNDGDFLPVIKIKEMNDGISENTEFVRNDISQKVIVNNGDVLFSWSASLDVKIWTGGTGGLNQHIFKVTSSKYPRTYFYFEVLSYLQHFKMIADLRKTTMGHITIDHLRQSQILIPKHDLIESLHEKINPLIELIIKKKEENHQLVQLRDWLLPMLMNGQVTVVDAYMQQGETLNMAAENKAPYTPAAKEDHFKRQWDNDLMMAVLVEKLGLRRGEVVAQKNVFNLGAFNPELDLFTQNYQFLNSNFGTYCYKLRDDLKINPYLVKQKVKDSDFFIIDSSKSWEINEAIAAPENRDFIKAINHLQSLYKQPFIKNKTDKIELLNTVVKLIIDSQTIDLESIYDGMKQWVIKQKGYKTKAEKFSKSITEKMLALLEEQNLIEVLLKRN